MGGRGMTVVLCQHLLVRPLPAMDLVPPGAGIASAGVSGGPGRSPPPAPGRGTSRPPPLPEPWLEAGGQRIQALELEQKAGLLTHMGERG